MATTILIILALWLVPGFLAYLIAAISSDDWGVDGGKILLIPVVNFVMLILVVMITIENIFRKR